MPNTGTGRTIFGPEIVVSNLLVYYDISNEKSYAGTGITVDTLTAYPAPNADLFGGASYVSTFPQSIEFAAASNEYLQYDLTNFGTSFTVMSIVSSPTSTWTDYGSFGGSFIFYGNGVPTNGFTIQPQQGSNRVDYYVINNSVNPTYNFMGFKLPSDITKPNLYYLSFDQNTGNTIYGVNDDVSTTVAGPLTLAGRAAGALQGIIGKSENSGFGRYMNMNFYAHMLYDRALTRNEILLNYQSLKPRFNL